MTDLNNRERNQTRVIGVRFPTSGETFFVDPGNETFAVGDWVLTITNQIEKIGRVVITSDQIHLNMLDKEIGTVVRKCAAADIEQARHLVKQASDALEIFVQVVQTQRLALTPIAAEYSFDGSHVTLTYTATQTEKSDHQVLRRDLASQLHCEIDLKQIDLDQTSFLLGGLGRRGLFYPLSQRVSIDSEFATVLVNSCEPAESMTTTSERSDRLPRYLGEEDAHYRVQKALMPQLGETIPTPLGIGRIIALKIFKQQITVRLERDQTDHIFTRAELDFSAKKCVES